MHMILGVEGNPDVFPEFERWITTQKCKDSSGQVHTPWLKEIRLFDVTMEKSAFPDLQDKIRYFINFKPMNVSKVDKIMKWVRRLGVIDEVKMDNAKCVKPVDWVWEKNGKMNWGVHLYVFGKIEDTKNKQGGDLL